MEVEATNALDDSLEQKTPVNGPVFFLIREQAKSVVAIKELQSRLSVLEDLQERLMQAVQNVQHHLISDKTGTQRYRSYASASPVLSNDCILQQIDITSHKNDLKPESLNLTLNSKGEFKIESINKDSGIGSEYKDHSTDLQQSFVPSNTSEKSDDKNSEDELLTLLNIIDQKSLLLLQQVEDVEHQRRACSLERMESKDGDSAPSLANHYSDNIITQRQLCEMKADRDDLKQRLAKLETATDAVVREKKKLQMKLENVVYENQQLQTKIKSASSFSQLNTVYDVTSPMKPSLAEIEKATMRRKYLQYSEKSRKKVARVLKETSILELQRQLLTYIMENDVLQAKLEQSEPTHLSLWMKTESRLKKKLVNANDDVSRLQKILEERNLEVTILRNRITELEDSLDQDTKVRNFGLNSNDDWRDDRYGQRRSSLTLPLGFGDFSKTQSLPAAVRLEVKGEVAANPVYCFNTEDFTEISLNGNSFSEQHSTRCIFQSNRINTKENNLLDLSDRKDIHMSNTNTLAETSYWTQQNTSTNWSVPTPSINHSHLTEVDNGNLRSKTFTEPKAFSTNLSKVHLCWKGTNSSAKDIDSICTEFDPLSGTPSCENFVDSLNLSIPLKPTQTHSHLSSAGDSLHSASLNLQCVSSSAWHENSQMLSAACSVDGIRHLLTETEISNFPKNKTFSTCGQNSSITSMISGRTAYPRPADMVDCMHSFSDQKLL